MDITMFLAQAFGLYMVIVGVALLMRPKLINGLIETLAGSADRTFLGGALTLIIGIPLVLVHSMWDGTTEIIVSVVVWITFLKGVLRVLFPDTVMSWGRSISNNTHAMKSLLLLMTVVGAYLLFVGFGV